MGSVRTFALGGIFAIALGPVVLLSGCSGEEKTGTIATVDEVKKQQNVKIEDKMRESMQNKKGAAKK